jgi:hypothetical protein
VIGFAREDRKAAMDPDAVKQEGGQNRREFLVAGGVAGAVVLPGRAPALAHGQPQPGEFHVKPLPSSIFIDHGINQETRLKALRLLEGHDYPAQGYGDHVPVPHPVRVG